MKLLQLRVYLKLYPKESCSLILRFSPALWMWICVLHPDWTHNIYAHTATVYWSATEWRERCCRHKATDEVRNQQLVRECSSVLSVCLSPRAFTWLIPAARIVCFAVIGFNCVYVREGLSASTFAVDQERQTLLLQQPPDARRTLERFQRLQT